MSIPSSVLFHRRTISGGKYQYANGVIVSQAGSKEMQKILYSTIAPYEGKISDIGCGKRAGGNEIKKVASAYKEKGVSLHNLMW